MASPKRPEGKWISRRWRLAASSPSQSWRSGVLGRFGLSKVSTREGVGPRDRDQEAYFNGAGHSALNRKPSFACTIASSLVIASTAPLLAV